MRRKGEERKEKEKKGENRREKERKRRIKKRKITFVQKLQHQFQSEDDQKQETQQFLFSTLSQR